MASPASYIPLVITETDGRIRPILLAQTTMPRRKDAITLGVHIRGVSHWYPGSSEASSQVLGAEYPPITFSGIFEDRRMGIPGAALALCLYIENVVKAGRECTLVYGPFIRRCRWTKFDFKPLEFQRIRYEAELQPIGDGLGKLRKRVKKGLRTTPDTETAIEEAQKAEEQLKQIKFDPAAEQSADSMKQVIQLEIDGEKILASEQLVTQERATAALSKFESGQDRMREAYERARDIVHKPGPDPLITLPSGFQTTAARNQILSASSLLNTVATKTTALAGITKQGVVYLTSDGDSLHRIAQRFYGSSERWVSIFEANGLSSPVLTAGQELLLPDVPGRDLAVAP